jgi:DNA-binding beta-propeller fold protein YncE
LFHCIRRCDRAALNGASKLVYSNYGAQADSIDFVASASTDGKDASVFALKGDIKGVSVPVMHVRDIAVDGETGDVYFVSYGGPTTAHVVRCSGKQDCVSIRKFEPSESEELLPSAVAFSKSLKRVFYAVADGALTKSVIYSAKPDGDDEQVFVKQSAETGVAFPVGLAIDDDNEHVYWTNDVGPDLVQRGDLTATAATNVGTLFAKKNTVRPFQIAIDPVGKRLYYVDQSSTPHSIGRIQTDAVDKYEELRTLSDGTPHDIVLDLENKKVFWSEVGTSTVKRGSIADLGKAPSSAAHATLSLLVFALASVLMF